jgi:hypothetical protein
MWYQSSNIPHKPLKRYLVVFTKHAYSEKEKKSQKLKVSLNHFNCLCFFTWKYFHMFHTCINFINDISHMILCNKHWNNFYISAMTSSIVKVPFKCWIWNTLIWIMNNIIYLDCTYTHANKHPANLAFGAWKLVSVLLYG